MNIAIIPIRSGSKRVRDKNIRLVCGKPLCFYLIDTMLSLKSISKVVVSTNSDKYKELINLNYGEEVSVIKRPEEISNDYSTLEECVTHVITELELEDLENTNIILSQATSPLTKNSSIQKAIEYLKNNENCKSVASRVKFSNFFTSNIPKLVERQRTQDMEEGHLETGCFWVFNAMDFINSKNRIIRPVHFLDVTKLESLDIDTEEDLFIVESVMKNLPKEKYFTKRSCSIEDLESSHDNLKLDPDGKKRNLSIEFKEKYEFYEEEIEFINNLVSMGKKFLDLGCGRGFFLDYICKDFETYALEVNGGYYLSISENVDIDKIYIGSLKEDTYPDEFFDVIFCGHVIEHVEDPVEFIKQTHRILKRHGHLIIATPDFDSIVANRFGPNFRLLHDKTHISLFGEKDLDKLLDDTGFHVDRTSRPFFKTKYFTQENLLRLFDTSQVSPPFYGNVITKYCRKK